MATPTERNAEQIQELRIYTRTLNERLDTQSRDLTRCEERFKESDKELRDTRQELMEARKENAVLRAEFDELKERFKTKEAWFRGLIASVFVALLVAVMSLIVALSRK